MVKDHSEVKEKTCCCHLPVVKVTGMLLIALSITDVRHLVSLIRYVAEVPAKYSCLSHVMLFCH